MLKKLFPFIFLLFSSCNHAFATQITYPVTWGTNDTVTSVKLNGDNNAVSNVVNGNLDNGNMATGFKLYQSVAALPAAGNQGTVDFLTTDNSLNIDTGATFIKTITPSGTLAVGDIPLYNASWGLLAPGVLGLPLVSNGTSSLPTYQAITVAGTVSGAALTSLASIPSGAGVIPAANIPTQTLLPISQTSISAAATTGNISITNGNTYLVKFNFVSLSGNDTMMLRFNADSGSHYAFAKNQSTSGSATAGSGSASSSNISFGSVQIGSGSAIGIQGSFYIQQLGTSSQVYFVWGQNFYSDSAGAFQAVSFGGQWSNAANVSSFSILTGGGATMTGVVDVYQVAAG